VTASSFTWLAYDDAEAEHLRRVVEAFGDKGTLDPIGFGPIRDAVADLLFPGISSIQTRARYFLLVPRIFQALEAQRVPARDFAARRKAEEVRLIRALLAGQQAAGATGNDADWLGIIGRTVLDRVRTPPSTIYWNGMYTFGIRQFPGATADHRRRLTDYYRRLASVQYDEDGEPIGTPPRNWDHAVPAAGQLPGEVESFELTHDESDYLASRIRLAQPHSLTAAMLRDGDAWRGATAPWEVPTEDAQLADLLRDAERFSLLCHGAQLLYNVLLFGRWRTELNATGTTDTEEALQEDVDAWTDEVAERRADLQEMVDHFPSFLERLTASGARIPDHTQRFFHAWMVAATTDPHTAVTDGDVAETIRRRERQLKGGLAKLVARPALESWAMRGQLQAAGRLAYRWSNGHRIVSDVLAGRAAA
jgi:hypothetical protein